MLVSYPGVVQDGQIQLQNAVNLPDGSQVIVVLNTMSADEWRKPFDTYNQLLEETSAEADIETISDEELVEIVHEARRSLK